MTIAKCPSLRWPARPLWRSLWQIRVSSAAGKPLLPIESSEVEQFVTTGLTIATSVAAWWKNNSFTAAAIEGRQADEQPEESGPLNERSNRV